MMEDGNVKRITEAAHTRGVTTAEMVRRLGMTRQNFYMKDAGKRYWSEGEKAVLTEMLCLTAEEADGLIPVTREMVPRAGRKRDCPENKEKPHKPKVTKEEMVRIFLDMFGYRPDERGYAEAFRHLMKFRKKDLAEKIKSMIADWKF